MADYFVKTTGSSGNNGTTWALAKALPSQALALAGTAGDRVVVAPGVYVDTVVDPAASGTSGSNSIFIGDIDSTITDGGANTSGVTAGPVSIIATHSTNGSYGPIWDTTNYWKVQRMTFSRVDPALTEVRGFQFGTPANASYGLGLTIEDCIFEAPFIAAQAYVGPESGTVFRRCVFIGRTPVEIYVTKSTAFSSNPDLKFVSCLSISSGGTNTLQYGHYLIEGAGNTSYAYIQFDNCVGIGQTEGQVMLDSYNTSYTKILANRCVVVGNLLTDQTANVTANNCYYHNYSTPGTTAGTKIDAGTTERPFWSWAIPSAYSSIKNNLSYTPSGEDVYDIIGRTLSTSPGCFEVTTGEQIERPCVETSDRGVAKLWAYSSGASSNVIIVEDD